MTLFTADGLIRGLVCKRRGGTHSARQAVARAYLRWLHTQGEAAEVDVDVSGPGAGWLLGHQELHRRRAPGNTCLSALHALRSPDDRARNNSKGCGGVMRMAPVGLFLAGRPERARLHEAFDLGAELAAITTRRVAGSTRRSASPARHSPTRRRSHSWARAGLARRRSPSPSTPPSSPPRSRPASSSP